MRDEAGESLTVEAWVNFQKFGNAKIVDKSAAYQLYTEDKYEYPYTYHFRCLVGGAWGSGVHSGATYSVCYTQYGGGLWIPGWHHVAFVLNKASGKASLYMDGVRISGPNNNSMILNNSTNPLKVGVTLNGSVDEVHISDVARYTDSNYTLPTLPFTRDGNTRALWHFDEIEGATLFHDACGTDNLLVGYNGAHTEGVPPIFTVAVNRTNVSIVTSPIQPTPVMVTVMLGSTPVSGAVITLSGAAAGSGTTGANGTVVLLVSPTRNGTITAAATHETHTNTTALTAKGDVNGDSRVSITDALFIAQYTANLRVLDSNTLVFADVSGDGRASITDALFIAQATAGIADRPAPKQGN